MAWFFDAGKRTRISYRARKSLSDGYLYALRKEMRVAVSSCIGFGGNYSTPNTKTYIPRLIAIVRYKSARFLVKVTECQSTDSLRIIT